jgi:hypothetical protein
MHTAAATNSSESSGDHPNSLPMYSRNHVPGWRIAITAAVFTLITCSVAFEMSPRPWLVDAVNAAATGDQ